MTTTGTAAATVNSSVSARHHSKHFRHFNSFNPHYYPMKQAQPHLTNEETEAQRD